MLVSFKEVFVHYSVLSVKFVHLENEQYFSMKNHIQLVFIIGLVGFLLRFLLWWNVPPEVLYDDHFEPTFLLLSKGFYPPPDACFECFQPPIFYTLNAGIVQLLNLFTDSESLIKKALQGVTFLFGVGALPLVWGILKQFNFSVFIKILLFAAFCFLPRHIFMGVTHSNDSALYFWVFATVYAVLLWPKKQHLSYWWLIIAVGISLAVLTKSIAIVLFPFAAIYAAFYNKNQSLKKRITTSLVVVSLPLVAFTSHLAWKSQFIGNPLKMNLEIFGMEIPQRPGTRDIHTFNLWEYWKMPLIRQENSESLLATLYLQFWFESEPKISNRWHSDPEFNSQYQLYINYQSVPVIPNWEIVSNQFLFFGRAAILIGLPFLLFLWLGIGRFFYTLVAKKHFDVIGLALLSLLALNLAGIISLTANYPLYSFMKGAFLLTSLPTFLYFMGKGIELTHRFTSPKLTVIPVVTLALYTSSYCVLLALEYA